MSDLQIGLIVLGVIVVVGVYAYNVRQERALRRRTEQAFEREHDDVLLQDVRSMPAEKNVRVEPKLESEPATAAAPTAPAEAADSGETSLDPVIDYVVEVSLPQPGDDAALHEELRALGAAARKPVLVSGSHGDGEWEDLLPPGGRHFARLRFAIQITNRAGCIEQTQLIAFRDAIVRWAARVGGDAKCPDVGEVHAMATQLDRFCADVDIAIGINVISADEHAFAGTKIRALAEAAGLKLDPNGVFHARDDDSSVLYALDNHEPMPFVPEQIKALSTRGITFLLDVPRVKAAPRAFEAMLATARTFAQALGGVLVDDNRTALAEPAIEKIRQQLQAILARMEAAQITAGERRAQRLFG